MTLILTPALIPYPCPKPNPNSVALAYLAFGIEKGKITLRFKEPLDYREVPRVYKDSALELIQIITML